MKRVAYFFCVAWFVLVMAIGVITWSDSACSSRDECLALMEEVQP